MKIYKLDIDTSKPTRQVVAMQQNSTGMLSVDVTNDGKYIRNLSCSLYDGDNEISATTENGYKIDVGGETKAVKFVAKSVPYDSENTYVANKGSGSGSKTVFCNKIQIKPGVYNQDEFDVIRSKFGDNNGFVTTMFSNQNPSPANFDRILIAGGAYPDNALYFYNSSTGTYLQPDEPVIVSSELSIGINTTVRRTGYVLSSETYPSVGYYTDYQMDTLIKPSTNAACYAEYDIAEPTPEEPEEEPPAEEPPAETDGE